MSLITSHFCQAHTDEGVFDQSIHHLQANSSNASFIEFEFWYPIIQLNAMNLWQIFVLNIETICFVMFVIFSDSPTSNWQIWMNIKVWKVHRVRTQRCYLLQETVDSSVECYKNGVYILLKVVELYFGGKGMETSGSEPLSMHYK